MTACPSRLGVLLAVAAVSLVTVACGGTRSGQAERAPDSTTEMGGATDSAPSATAPASSTSLADLDVCGLLPADFATKFALGPGKLLQDDKAGKYCEFPGNGYRLSIVTAPSYPYDRKIPDWEMSPTSIPGTSRKAVLLKTPSRQCGVSMEVGESSGILVSGQFSNSSNIEPACQLGRVAAQVVEPNLPTG